MGKYFINNNKKTNTKCDVAHGVRTRARTLALRSFDSSFLQLHFRCLVKKIYTPVSKQVEEKNQERSGNESTPCNSIMAADNKITPGSTTKQRCSTQNGLRNIPTKHEMDEFFTQAEHSQQKLFVQKYNFDVVQDKPLPGRYEWVKVIPQAEL